ncbi:MAG: pyruvoyl-dependent arginine decarboxylase [Promethearchaeota archaeon]
MSTPITLVPDHIFFTKGIGRDKNKLIAFEKALRDARIQPFNLVAVSSIYPPNVVEVSIEDGLKMLKPGQIVFCVMSKNESNELNRMVSASIGCAVPADNNTYGYISEHHAFGQTEDIAGEYAEDLAAIMLATTLGIPFDVDKNYDERKEVFRMSGKIVETKNVTATAIVNKDKEWTCVLAAAVFVKKET